VTLLPFDIRRQQFPHPEKIHNQIKEHVDKLVDLGIVKPFQSDWSCPCFLAPKKKDDGTWFRERFVIDVRGLNIITKKISFPSVRREDILDKLRNSKYFSNFHFQDFSAGYWQIPMTEEAQRKSTFICREGTFAFTVMPFGLANALH
jgi:hypothetical protein